MQPYKNNGIELRNIDCLELLKTLPDNSVDFINVDPPYNIGFDGGAGWDTIDDYHKWCRTWIKEAYRVLKPNRMFGVWGTFKDRQFLKTIDIVDNIDFSGERFIPQQEIIWSYNWGGRTKSNFARKHEYCFFWSKGDEFLFNPNDVLIERKVKTNLRTGKPFEKGTVPTSVWEKNNHTTSKDYIGWHPTTKNVEIIERMIKAYTNVGDIVLDFFSGSGSTAVACNNTGRKFIGSEMSKDYFKKTLERLKNL
jgi:site-specific DNA-methyltransferase (adenine-specific)